MNAEDTLEAADMIGFQHLDPSGFIKDTNELIITYLLTLPVPVSITEISIVATTTVSSVRQHICLTRIAHPSVHHTGGSDKNGLS